MSLFTAPPDVEVVRGILLDLSRVCNRKVSTGDDDDDGIESTVTQEQQQEHQRQQLLHTLEASEKANPQFVMALCTLITPNLFLGPSESLNLTHQESITVLMFLATKTNRPETYLKAASRAIKTFIQTTTYQYTESVTPTGTEQFQVSNNLLQLMIAQLSGNDVEVSTNATEAVVACCRRLPHLSENALVALEDAWKTTWERKDVDKQNATTVCVRCANAIVELWCLPGNHNRPSTSSSLNPLLVMMTDSSDPLLQMSTLDLMEKLATVKPIHPARAQWLYSPSVIQPLLSMAGASDTPDPFMSGPALRLLSCLAKLCHYLQDVNHDHAAATDSATAATDLLLTPFHHILQTFDLSGGEIDRLAFIDAVSSLASASSKALELVLGDPILLERWLSLAVAQPKLKAVVLLSLARVIYPPMEEPQQQQQYGDASIHNVPNTALAIQLYLALGRMNGNRNVTDLLLHLARSPVIESRLGAYAVFEAVAKHGAVGSQVLLSHADFYDLLISRQHDSTMEGKEAKYAIVVAIVNSNVRTLLADNIVKTLDTYVAQGPHYVPTQRWDVMTGE
ncbi:Proteasome non-ATPase 26S subunit [Fragilaria crotonensis]|nr:Proteasome non-ATPase 26S subunit [Fragilaria crotonensis]